VRYINLFDSPSVSSDREQFETLFRGKDILIERILSVGHATAEGEWYDQERDEWAAVLQGEAILAYEDGRSLHLGPGDHVLIPAHTRHRVEWTSRDPVCIWLAVHAGL
jgi:cupin 2 domain-containing protein